MGRGLRYTAQQIAHMSETVDLNGLARRLRQLRPEAEKVIRMYFGLGCQRCHSAQEMAAEFGVTTQRIAGLIGAAQRRLAREGVTAEQLRAAARQEKEAGAPSGSQSGTPSLQPSEGIGHRHHRA